MKIKKIISLLLALTLVFALCACAEKAPGEDPSEGADFSAVITEVGESYILVTPDEGSDAAMSSDSISAAIDGDTACFGLDGQEMTEAVFKVGQRVKITYNGDIAETYPAQITALEIRLLEDVKVPVVTGTPLNFTFDGYYCKVTIPDTWEGKYEYAIGDDQRSIDFFSANNREYGGLVFAIWMLTDKQVNDPECFDFCDGEPLLLDGDMSSGISFYLVRPFTDVEFNYDDEVLRAEYELISGDAEAVGATFAWKHSDDKNDIDEDIDGLKAIFDEISASCFPGTAGSSLTAVKYAGMLLDWEADSNLEEAEITAVARAWYLALDDERSELFPEQLNMVYESTPQLFGDAAEDVLSSAGYEAAAYPWDAAHTVSLFTAIYSGVEVEMP